MTERLGVSIGQLGDRNVRDAIELAVLVEECGYELVLVPESWGRDAVAVLAAIAGRTTRIRIGSGILNAVSRTPALIAMAAGTLDELSGGRFVLGLGASAAAVNEGWHGRSVAAPLTNLRETTQAVRYVLSASRTGFAGSGTRIAPGFALRFKPPRARIPIWWASLAPRALRQCGEFADGWLPTIVTAEGLASEIDGVLAGLRKSGRDRTDMTIAPQIPVAVHSDITVARDRLRPHVALYLGGMGSFYQDTVRRHGYASAVAQASADWAAGRRDGAALGVDVIDALTLAGPVERCRARLAQYRDAGADIPVLALPSGVSTTELAETIRALAPR